MAAATQTKVNKSNDKRFLSLIKKLSQSIDLVEKLAKSPDTGIKVPDFYLKKIRFVRDCVECEAPLYLLDAADLAGWTKN